MNKLKRWKAVTDAGLSASAIADAHGWHKGTVSRLLNGETWSDDKAETIASMVGYSVAEMWPKQVRKAA